MFYAIYIAFRAKKISNNKKFPFQVMLRESRV